MKVESTHLPGVLIITPDVHRDARGSLVELWREERYRAFGMDVRFVQDNLSYSKRGTLRGLHVQEPEAQAKLVTVLEGEVFDVAVDVRRGSPTFGKWVGVTLSGADMRQLFIPEGFAHGFQVISEAAQFHYKTTRPYRAEAEIAIAWNSPDIGIDWPKIEPVLSPRDAQAPGLHDVSARLPSFQGSK